MSSTMKRSETAVEVSRAQTVAMKLEVVVIPVADVERAKRFYGGLGWRLDADFAVGNDFRVVQFTPPGSQCSIQFGTGITPAAPGSASGLYLVVSDIEAARAELVDRGVEVSEVFHVAGPGTVRPISGARTARTAQLRFVRIVQRSGRQQLAAAGDHRAAARTRRRRRHDIHLVDRPRERAAACGDRAWRAREAHRRSTTRTGRTGTPRTWSREQAGKPLPT